MVKVIEAVTTRPITMAVTNPVTKVRQGARSFDMGTQVYAIKAEDNMYEIRVAGTLYTQLVSDASFTELAGK
jgi:hypothetical protein